MRDAALTKAIAAVGGVAALARGLEIAPQAVSQWRRVPADRAGDVERLTKVPRSELRPDLWEEVVLASASGDSFCPPPEAAPDATPTETAA